MSKPAKRHAIEEWKIDGPLQQRIREQRGIFYVPPNEVDDYRKLMAEVRAKTQSVDPPVMPLKAVLRPGQTIYIPTR